MFKRTIVIAAMMTLAGHTLLADFTYQENTTITGGLMMSMMKVVGVFSKQAREPIHSTVAVKGDKMVHRSGNSASVIDLASGTITSIDFQKKQYSVMTFDEMKQALDQMAQKMQKNNKGEVNFKVSANSTDKTKQVSGFEAKEMVLKMEMQGTDKQSGQKGGMVITTDMWVASGVPGYEEVRNFQKRMAEKLNWTPGGNMFMQNPQVSQGMAEVYKEMAKLDGVPVQQFISMGADAETMKNADGGQSGNGGQQQQQQQQQPQAERPSLGSALGGRLSGLGGLGRKKKEDKPADQPAAAPANSGNPGSLLEMTTEMTNFSAGAADPSLFDVPTGFKKVDSDLKKMR